MFTGDRSGDWLYAALHAHGFATQPTSVARNDGLKLIDAYITAAARCAPPDNKPTPAEMGRCQPFLLRELEMLRRVRVVLALGKIAFDTYLAARLSIGAAVPKPRPAFRHGGETDLGDVLLLSSYHPSQQNTFTGRLTKPAFDAVFRRARQLVEST